jgi:hypothetical protein
MPDGIFSFQKSQFGYIFEGLRMEIIGIIYEHLIQFTAVLCILYKFGTFCGHLVYFFPFWYVAPRKIWQPGQQPVETGTLLRVLLRKKSFFFRCVFIDPWLIGFVRPTRTKGSSISQWQ